MSGLDGERVTQIARDRAFGHEGMYDRGLAYVFAQIGGEGFENANDLLMGKLKLDVDEEGEPIFEKDDWKPPKRNWVHLIDDINDIIREKIEDMEECENILEKFAVEVQINYLIAIRDEAIMELPIALDHFKQYMELLGNYG